MSSNNDDVPAVSSTWSDQPTINLEIRHILSDEVVTRRLRNWISARLRGYEVTGRRNAERSDDVFQQVCLKALEKEGSFDPVRGKGFGWLRTLADRIITDEHRMNRKLRSDSSVCLDELPYESDSSDILADTELARIRDTIAKLSRRDQKVYEERFVNCKAGTELAIALDCKPEAARVRVHRLKKTFESLYISVHSKRSSSIPW